MTLGGTPILRDLSLEVRDLYRPGYYPGSGRGPLGAIGHGQDDALSHSRGPRCGPIAGRVLVEPRSTRQCNAAMVGVIAQHYPLFAHRTVRGNLIVAGSHTGTRGGHRSAGR